MDEKVGTQQVGCSLVEVCSYPRVQRGRQLVKEATLKHSQLKRRPQPMVVMVAVEETEAQSGPAASGR